jgi:hypothetical protein
LSVTVTSAQDHIGRVLTQEWTGATVDTDSAQQAPQHGPEVPLQTEIRAGNEVYDRDQAQRLPSSMHVTG